MRIIEKCAYSQLKPSHFLPFIIVFCSLIFFACGNRREEISLIPPLTSPLSKDYIGFGVITASFTHITADPSDDSPSQGYLRRGSLVRIVRRQTIRTHNSFVTWVLIDGTDQGAATTGWLKEEVIDIYSNESQARTASESILK